MCARVCMHACIRVQQVPSLSFCVRVCVCVGDSYHLCLSLSLLCLFCVAIKFFSFFLLDTFVFSLFLKWFCFTKLSEYVEDYGHSQTLVC